MLWQDVDRADSFFCHCFFVAYYYYNRILMLIYKVRINVRAFFSKRKYSIIFCHHTVFVDDTIKKRKNKIKCDSNYSQQRKILVSPSLPSVLHLQTVPDRDTLLITIATQRGLVTNTSICFAPAGSLQKPAVRLWTWMSVWSRRTSWSTRRRWELTTGTCSLSCPPSWTNRSH